MEASLLGFAALMVLILARVPLGIAMGIVGVIGFALVQQMTYGNPRGWSTALNMIASTAFDTGLAYGLSVVPLFLLMGNLITESGMSKELYRAANAFLGALQRWFGTGNGGLMRCFLGCVRELDGNSSNHVKSGDAFNA